jgi:Cu2+-exporting ATPase
MRPAAPNLATPGATRAGVDCSHCGLPVAPDLVQADASEQFCCGGCRAVYRLLHEEGLEDYYRLQDDSTPQPARVSGRSYAELDDPSFHQRYCQPSADGTESVELYLEGVRCTACVWLIERLPRLLPGVVESRLDMGRSRAEIRWDAGRVQLSQIARRLDRFGYPPHPFRGAERARLRRAEERRLLIRIAVAGAAAGNVMLIAFALYSGAFGGMAAEYATLFRWASLLITIPALVYSGSVFFRGAFGALRAGALHMDLPISIGVGIGFAWGAINTLRGSGEIYFDSVCALIFLLLVGRYLQQRQQRSAADATEMLFSLTPSSARLVEREPNPTQSSESESVAAQSPAAGLAQSPEPMSAQSPELAPAQCAESARVDVREVPIDALLPGVLVEVRAGDSVPADGVIVEGRSAIDLAILSGESRPASVSPGDEVFAGSLNLVARVLLRVTATGEQTRVGRLMRAVEEYAHRRAPVVLMADRISGWFVATTLTLAALTAGLWWPSGGQIALEHAVALLIVTCPCALGLATPLAVSVAIGRAARAGILLKGGDVVERLSRRGRVLLDKTGTLTEGRTTLESWNGSQAVKPQVVALERQSAHHLALSLVAALTAEDPGGDGLQLEVAGVRETVGSGIDGSVAGVRLRIGAPAFVEAEIGELPDWGRRELQNVLSKGLTPVLVAREGKLEAVAGLGDPLRADAPSVLQQLRQRGWELSILSGDHPAVVQAVARRLGIASAHAQGGATPEQKLAHVERLLERGPVVMVGDGVNDAAALSAATCGIAVHGGAEASLAAADAFVSRPGLSGLGDLFDGAEATLRVIKRNLAFSLAYNLAGALLAMLGIIGPLWAAVLMPLSSLTVVTSSFHARTFQQRGPATPAETS